MKDKNSNDKSTIQKIWENPIGKGLIITTSVLATILLIGASLEVITYTTNKYKDFRVALKR